MNNIVLPLFFLLVFCLSINGQVNDKSNLELLYDITGGDQWIVKTNWGTGEPCDPTFPPLNSSWHGIACAQLSLDFYAVARISLPSNNLKGNISAFPIFPALGYLDLKGNSLGGELFNLSVLPRIQFLDLSNNTFSGTLKGLDLLSSIRSFSISDNQLTGNLPSSLFKIQLGLVNLGNNRLEGSIPNVAGSPFLQSLNLSSNLFDGNPPATLSSLSRILSLDLHNNQLDGTLDIFSPLKSLNLLDLSYNHFRGELGEWISNFTSLASLSLSANRITGPFPLGLSRLSSILSINLGNNRMTGVVPPLDQLKQLLNLNLTSNAYEGEIPESIGRLTNLKQLILARNMFSGKVPNTFGWPNFQNLLYLDISFNQITRLPDNLGGPLLAYLNAADCQLSGRLPSGLWNSTRLSYIIIFGNHFSGEIPESIGNLRFLLYVWASSNVLEGRLPKSLSNCTFLNYFAVDFNQLEGELPDLSSLKGLDTLSISYNRLNGTLPPTISSLRSCTFLNLAGNSFTGSVPQEISSMTLLQRLDLSSNQLNGSIDFIMGLRSLTTIYLSNNEFEGDIPNGISSLQRVTEIDFHNNNLNGSLPYGIGFLSNLVYLDVSANDLVGIIPRSVNNLKRCKTWNLSQNRLDGPIPTQFQLMDDLQYFNVSFNLLNDLETNVIPNTLQQLVYFDFSHNLISKTLLSVGYLKRLKVLKLNHNLFTGGIPTDLQQLASLEEIDLSSNLISGTLPYTLGYLQNLKICNISNNFIGGNIPESVGLLPNIQILDYSNNRMEGSIADSLGGMKGATYLNWSNNLLSGSIPESIGNLTSLITLDLSGNRLNGTLPSSFGSMISLVEFNLEGNAMIGSVPESIGNPRTLLRISMAGNKFEGKFPVINSLLNYLDISGNQFTGSMDFLSTAALDYFNASGNHFTGSIPNLDSARKLQVLDLSNNQLSEEIPSLRFLFSIRVLDLSNNQLNGSVPSLSELNPEIQVLNFEGNRLKELISLPQYSASNNFTCNFNENPLECPIPWLALTRCRASCGVVDRSYSSIRIRISGSLSSFASEPFLDNLSKLTNTTRSRFRILSLTSGSVIVDLEVGPPPSNSINEGSAARFVSDLPSIFQSRREEFNNVGIQVLSTGQVPQSSVPSKNTLSTGATVAIVVVVIFVVLAIGVGIAVFLLLRYKKKLIRNVPNPFEMIDLTQIKLGEAKKSIVDYDDLKNFTMIGAGAYGVVYRCNWRELTVACKQIRSERISEQSLKDFLSEVSILQGLRPHPNVVLFMGLTFPPQPLSIITEFCDGGSLYDYLLENDVSLEQKYKFIRGISLGLLHLHLEKVIHRDLAARNILLTKHLDVKVSDFGLSREQAQDSAALTNSEIGPIKWMAPESIRSRQYSVKSDVYSFGTVVYEILTELEPYQGMTAMDVAIGVTTRDLKLEIPEEIEDMWAKLMSQCWERDPADRPDLQQICSFIGATQESQFIESQSVMTSHSGGRSKSSGSKSKSSKSRTTFSPEVLSQMTAYAPVLTKSASSVSKISDLILQTHEPKQM
eukprot:TRINITY_DN4209_c0_g1_i1.p1 TRINITY_DN4209_c0_g1~~TRINITY_DN4209_c0_g1_i1.p1  ORF type:complete len:1530 (+),score=362.20 TRINITY_DN4209_c0_g1_i1:189-4778(+)